MNLRCWPNGSGVVGACAIVLALAFPPCLRSEPPGASETGLSPTALVAAPDGRRLYVACATANTVVEFDTIRRSIVRRIEVPESPSGLAPLDGGARLVVTCASAVSKVVVVECETGIARTVVEGGHTAMGPVVDHVGGSLFVCERFHDAVDLFSLPSLERQARIPVKREPVSAVPTPDGRHLLVANHLPQGRSDVKYVAACVSVIDVASRRVVREVRLPNGAINLREMRVSPDGQYACLALTLGRFQVPVTHLERGWVNTSALTIIKLPEMEALNTVLLDDVDDGAANPRALGWSADGRWLCVTHAGTHELSIIDFPALLEKLAAVPREPSPAFQQTFASSRRAADVPNDLSFLQGLRRRVKLGGNGPRALAIAGGRAFVAGYFSDTIDIVDLGAKTTRADTIALNPGHRLSAARRGEMYFNDATLCFQGWQSCATCHDDDARVDGLNWDLLNDGIGNPKDTRSLLLSYQTPPSMSLGVRATAAVAVRSGIHNSLASVLPEEVPAAMDEWLKNLKPLPSPRLVNGALSESARRGEKIFKSAAAACASCHEPELYTDLRSYDVGTRGPFDQKAGEFDTPTLRELWRTAPYLHDGSAATLREVVTTRNTRDEHGKTSNLSAREVEDLVEYLLSL